MRRTRAHHKRDPEVPVTRVYAHSRRGAHSGPGWLESDEAMRKHCKAATIALGLALLEQVRERDGGTE